MTRVIHTGDTHLGYRQYHSPERRRDFLEAFRRVVEDAIAEEVDAVVHAGDLFHDRSPALADVHGAIRVLRDLRDADIPFLAVVGNHERTRGGQWLDLFQTLGLATRLDEEPTRVGDVAFYGLDFVPRSKRDDLDYAFADHDAAHAALVAHGLFTPFNAEWRIEDVLAGSPVAFDAVLLGDDHQPDTARVEGTWVTYCGSTERASAAERAERGYNLVDFDAEDAEAVGEGVSIRRRGIETRPFVTVDVELGEGEGADRVRERLAEEAVEDAVVVVGIEGEGEDLQPARIEAYATERGALVARVTDRRELEAATLDAVRFADPDAAVTDRLRELGLSEAALAIDEVVRSDVADANVRGRVRERVESLLEEPGALEPGEPLEAEPDDVADEETATEPTEAEAVATTAGPAATDEGPAGVVEAPTAKEADAVGADEDAGSAAPVPEPPEEEHEPTPADEGAAADADEAEPDDSGAGDDGQVTMEDYL